MVARTAQAMVLSKTSQRVKYVFDTFMDVDRGYFPRHAFIDRRFDPHPAARTFSTLNALLSSAQQLVAQPIEGGLAFTTKERNFQLIDSLTPHALERVQAAPTGTIIYDLFTGTCSSLDDSVSNLADKMTTTRQVLLLQMP
jgi:hypothetical protein